jgi:hypothetical protein
MQALFSTRCFGTYTPIVSIAFLVQLQITGTGTHDKQDFLSILLSTGHTLSSNSYVLLTVLSWSWYYMNAYSTFE